jgi:hypothetical protein
LYHFHHAPRTLLRLSFHGHFRTATTTTARLVRIIVPSPPGGSTDVLAHVLSQQIEETAKQTKVRFRDHAEPLSFLYEIIVISVAVF